MFRFAYLAFRDLGHYRGRTALAIIGIAVVVAVYFTLAGVALHLYFSAKIDL